MRRHRLVAAVALCGLLLAACGIPMQEEPKPLPSGAVPQGITSPAP